MTTKTQYAQVLRNRYSNSGGAVQNTVVGANIPSVDNSSLIEMFTDLVLGTGQWNALTGGGYAPVDSTGWPTTDFSAQVMIHLSYSGIPTQYWVSSTNGGTYNCIFTGIATVQLQLDSSSPYPTVTYNSGTNTSTFSFTIPAGENQVFINFTNTQRTSASATNTGITNFHCYVPGYSASSLPFSNKFLANVTPRYGTYRFMDWLCTANTAPLPNTITWAGRPTPANSPQIRSAVACAQGNGRNSGPISWELLVQFVNYTGANMWINIPYGATNDYITQLATALLPGGSLGLNSTSLIYVEFSNEQWNTDQAQGAANGVDFQIENQCYGPNCIASSVVNSGVCTVTFNSTFTGGGALNGSYGVGNPSRTGGHTLTNGQTIQTSYICDTVGTTYVSTVTVVSSTVITFTVPSGSPNFGGSPGNITLNFNSVVLGQFGNTNNVFYNTPSPTVATQANIAPSYLTPIRTAQKIVNVSNLFRAVWGNSAMGTRIRCILAGKADSPGEVIKVGLDWIQATQPNPPSYYLWGTAGAPYWEWTNAADGSTTYTPAQLITDLYQNNVSPTSNAVTYKTAYNVAISTFYGLTYTAYETSLEGNATTYGTTNTVNKINAQITPASTLGLAYDMQTIATAMFQQQYQYGAGMQMQFAAGAGSWASGAFYCPSGTSALETTLRTQAIDAVNAAGFGTPSSVPAVTLGAAVSVTTCLNLTQTGDFSMQLFPGYPNEGYWWFYLSSAQAGARTLTWNQSSGNSACTYNFFIDNVRVGTNVSMPTGNTVGMPVTLAAGIHTIRITPTANPGGVNLHSWTLSLSRILRNRIGAATPLSRLTCR